MLPDRERCLDRPWCWPTRWLGTGRRFSIPWRLQIATAWFGYSVPWASHPLTWACTRKRPTPQPTLKMRHVVPRKGAIMSNHSSKRAEVTGESSYPSSFSWLVAVVGVELLGGRYPPDEDEGADGIPHQVAALVSGQGCDVARPVELIRHRSCTAAPGVDVESSWTAATGRPGGVWFGMADAHPLDVRRSVAKRRQPGHERDESDRNDPWIRKGDHTPAHGPIVERNAVPAHPLGW